MFRASKWNGNAAVMLSWQSRENRIPRKQQGGHRSQYIFDYGFMEGQTVLWGAHDPYEGRYEDGKKHYLYDVKGRTYYEWNRNGIVTSRNP
jgi:hypothetical protein